MNYFWSHEYVYNHIMLFLSQICSQCNGSPNLFNPRTDSTEEKGDLINDFSQYMFRSVIDEIGALVDRYPGLVDNSLFPEGNAAFLGYD